MAESGVGVVAELVGDLCGGAPQQRPVLDELGWHGGDRGVEGGAVVALGDEVDVAAEVLAEGVAGPEKAPGRCCAGSPPRLTRRLEAHLDAIDAGAELTAERRQDLLACLYGLHTLLELHFLQEEESYFALVTE